MECRKAWLIYLGLQIVLFCVGGNPTLSAERKPLDYHDELTELDLLYDQIIKGQDRNKRSLYEDQGPSVQQDFDMYEQDLGESLENSSEEDPIHLEFPHQKKMSKVDEVKARSVHEL